MSEVPEAPENLEEIADGAPHKLDLRHVTVERITGWIFTLVLSGLSLVGLLVALFVSSPGTAKALAFVVAWVVMFAAFAALSHFWPAALWRHASWALDARGLEIRRGVLWREVVHVPRSRVQHTDVTQGPIQRAFGLATLTVHTAGREEAQVDLSGIAFEEAQRIRQELTGLRTDDVV